MHHRQHALQLAAQVTTGPSPQGRRWGEQGGDLLPERLAQRGRAWHDEDGDRSRSQGAKLRWGRALRPTDLMPKASDRLMLAPPLRPAQMVVALGARRLGHQQQQAPHLRDRQRDQLGSVGSGSPPALTGAGVAASWGARAASAPRRVTSK